MRDAKSDILFRVYLLYIAMLLFGVAIIVRMAYIQFKLGDDLLQKADQQELHMFDIEATRGNILASDGSLLATSVPVFEIRMDVASPLIDDAFSTAELIPLPVSWPCCSKTKPKLPMPTICAGPGAKATAI